MINRIIYRIKELPPDIRREDILSYIEDQPNYEELTLRACSDIGKIAVTIPWIYSYQYKEYFIEVIPLNKQLFITFYKVTPGVLTKKYEQIREKLTALNLYLDDFYKELRLKEYRAYRGARLDMIERVNMLKREIKTELRDLGIPVKVGSNISRLLRLDYLPDGKAGWR